MCNCACLTMVSLQLRALVGGAGKGVVLAGGRVHAGLRDGGLGGVTFSHLPGKISERNSTEEGTRAAVTKGRTLLLISYCLI